MSELEPRVTELELRFMEQQDLLEQLDTELVASNARAELLEKRVKRLEETLQEVLPLVTTPGNEKPPHY